ncbi:MULTISPECIES: hypothetical protein [unclassified Streptomyces]|uniref:hypothetical protein n=1 Tax=unclassified Streptomyces TaxID=2593676 RepID=UPI0036EE78F0
MPWDEWEQLKSDAAERHSARMQLNQYPAGEGPGSGSTTSSVTGGLKSSQGAWNKAGEGVGSLHEGIGRAQAGLGDGQKGLGDGAACLTAGAQKEVYASWMRYTKAVSERCDGIKGVLHQVGRDLLKTDGDVKAELDRLKTKYADTQALCGQEKGR